MGYMCLFKHAYILKPGNHLGYHYLLSWSTLIFMWHLIFITVIVENSDSKGYSIIKINVAWFICKTTNPPWASHFAGSVKMLTIARFPVKSGISCDTLWGHCSTPGLTHNLEIVAHFFFFINELNGMTIGDIKMVEGQMEPGSLSLHGKSIQNA